MLRRLLFMLLVSLPALAQNFTAVTGSNTSYVNGTKVTGQVCFIGTDTLDQNNPINFQQGGGGQVAKRPKCSPITNGVTTSFNVPNPSFTTPAGVRYRITITDSSGTLVLEYDNVKFTGGSFNLDTYSPTDPVSMPISGGSVSGNLGINGNLNVTGTITATGGLSCTNCVDTSTNQTVGGIKTFTSNMLFSPDSTKNIGDTTHRISILHTTNGVQIGDNPAANAIGLQNGKSIGFRNVANSGDITALRVGPSNKVELAGGVVTVDPSGGNIVSSGAISGVQHISSQGTACTNGELALSGGWGTTATVTSVFGQGQTCGWTVTSSGTGQAANPTLTDTLTNALPSASVACDMRMTGGTGTATLVDQTTLSATAPIFTFGGTPVAGSTYKIIRRCGP